MVSQSELALQVVAIDQVSREIEGPGHVVVGLELELDDAAPPFPAGMPVAGTHGQAVEPGIPRVGVTQRAQVPPG